MVGDSNFNADAGHILSGSVSTGSPGVMIIPHDKKLEREMDELSGAKVLTSIMPDKFIKKQITLLSTLYKIHSKKLIR